LIQLSKGHPPQRAQWFAKLGDAGVRFRTATLYGELRVLHTLRPTAKAALVPEAKRDPAWFVLPPIAFVGPVRVALLLATLQTPWRFRTKRQRPKEHGVDDGEDREVCPDAEHHRKKRYSDEAGRAGECAKRVTEIAQEMLHGALEQE